MPENATLAVDPDLESESDFSSESLSRNLLLQKAVPF